MAVGDTLEEMYALSEDAKRAWMETAITLGRPIPEPCPIESAQEKSGKFVVRIPAPIHSAIAREAERQQISLNELVSTTLTLVAGNGLSGLLQAIEDGNKRGGSGPA